MTVKNDKDIELLLIWAYQDQCVGGGEMIMLAGEGGEIGSCSSPGGPAHEDAEALYHAVGQLPKRIRIMVVDCARSGLRPNWMEGKTTNAEPVYGWKRHRVTGEIVHRKGQPVPNVYEYSADNGNGKSPAWCRIRWQNRPEQILNAQARYLEWWAGLAMLTGLNLKEHNAIGPSANRTPWLHIKNG